MRRINWWRGQRITYQERRKQNCDLELSLNRILHTFGRTMYGSHSATPDAEQMSATWSSHILPNYSMSLSDTISHAEFSLVCATPASAVHISANIQVDVPFIVYFKSGESRRIPSGTWEFEISANQNTLTSANFTLNTSYAPWICFTADKVGPTTSAEIEKFIVSAYDNWTDTGFVQNSDSLTIKPVLYSNVPSASFSEVLGVRWVATTAQDNSILASNINPNTTWQRIALYERQTYNDTDGYEITYDEFQHMAPFACCGTVFLLGDGSVNGWAGAVTATEFTSATISGGFNYLAMHIGVDDRVFPNLNTGNDSVSYSQYLSAHLSHYPSSTYLPTGVVAWTLFPSANNFTPTSIFASPIAHHNRVSAKKIYSLDLRCDNHPDGGSSNSPYFDTTEHLHNHVFGALYNDTYYIFRTRKAYCGAFSIATTATYVEFDLGKISTTGTSIYSYGTNATHGPFGYRQAIDVPGSAASAASLSAFATYSALPKNSFSLDVTGSQAFLYLYASPIAFYFSQNLESTNAMQIFEPNDANISHFGNVSSVAWIAAAGHTASYDSTTKYLSVYGRHSTLTDLGADGWEGHGWIHNLSATDRNMLWCSIINTTNFSKVADISGVTSDAFSGDNYSPIAIVDNNVTYSGLKKKAFSSSAVSADIDASLNMITYNNPSAYVAMFENNSSGWKNGLKLFVTYFPSGSDSTTAGSGRVDKFYTIDHNMYSKDIVVLFEKPLTGASASSGWYSHVVSLEAPTDSSAWYCAALENKTNTIDIYKIFVPQKLYGWNK